MSEVGKAWGRIAALDVGDVWTGVAVSDATCQISRPVEVVGSGELTEFLRSFAREQSVCEVVVGVPKTLQGEVGFQAQKVLGKLEGLKDEFPELRFIEWDERFTTRMAAEEGAAVREKKTKKRGARRAKEAKGRVDHLAAARMLQEYLEARGNS